MSRRTEYICDRCSQRMQSEHWWIFKMPRKKFWLGPFASYDLCSKCEASLVDWWHAKRRAATPTEETTK